MFIYFDDVGSFRRIDERPSAQSLIHAQNSKPNGALTPQTLYPPQFVYGVLSEWLNECV